MGNSVVMPSHTGRLVLTTADPQLAPDRRLVSDLLTEVGLIGSALGGAGDAYEAGPELLSLLSFAGCAVVLPTASGTQGDTPGCHVRLLGPEPAPRLISGRNTRGPRCPGCRSRLRDWRGYAREWLDQPLRGQRCPSCGVMSAPVHWDWKQEGGFGRLFVLVEEVFPGEAVPTQRLLDLLTRACGSAWRHFYVQD